MNVVLEELSSSQENELLNIFWGATQSKNSYYEVRKPFVYFKKFDRGFCNLTMKKFDWLLGFGRQNFLSFWVASSIGIF